MKGLIWLSIKGPSEKRGGDPIYSGKIIILSIGLFS